MAVDAHLGELPRELRAEGGAVPARELVDDHPADVVPVALVLAARVSEAHDEQFERRGLLAPTEEPHGLALDGALAAGGVRPRLGGRLGATLRRFLALRDALGALLALLRDLLGLLGATSPSSPPSG